MKLSCPLEHEEQVAFVKWLRLVHPRVPFIAIPNGGWRHKATAGRLKAEGAQPGAPDLMIPVPIGDKHGLFIEMKRERGGQLSESQKEFIPILREHGYAVEVCAGALAAIEAFERYFKN